MSPGKHKLGFRILPAPPRLSDDIVTRFRGLAPANLADAMGRFNFMDPGMQSRTGLSMCGLAVTVRCRPADNLMVHKALEIAEPGDVVVVSTCGNTTSAVFGELMCHTATAKKLGGIVVDGAIRDVDGISALGFPAVSRAVCPGGCDKDGPGEINVPIACGGTVVMPGDVVGGDSGGVTVVPRDHAVDVLRLVGALMSREAARIAEILQGRWFKAEIDDALRRKGVID
ncbi:MAG: RraA family protein [Gemmatimonadaceae bacterium]